MGIVPKAEKPGLTLAEVVSAMDAEPKTAEVELACADFMMLPQAEQNRILFLGLMQNSASLKWCIASIQRACRD